MSNTVINAFPGYKHIPGTENKGHGRNMYRGIDLGFGGYVYSEPGMYKNVALLDVSSLHPSSIIALNKLGQYTKTFKDLRDARVYIKHHDYDSAGKLFGGKLKKYLTSDEEADALAKALKLPINSFFGISFASFDNPARDSRDINDIIALRGALFMKTLQDEVTQKGFKVIHIKTDSIKIVEPTKSIIKFCMDFAKQYGYEFEHECTYDRICLVNDADYIAKYDDQGIRNKGGKKAGQWTVTGKKFAAPYLFKTLFSHEEIIFDDMCEVFNVKEGGIYLDMNEHLPDVTDLEKEFKKTKDETLLKKIAKGHDYQFIGNVGRFTPVVEGQGGGVLVRIKDGKSYALSGTKGYRWLESEMIQSLNKENYIDRSYYRKLVDDAVDAIGQFGNVDEFIGMDCSKVLTIEDYVNNVPDSPEEFK